MPAHPFPVPAPVLLLAVVSLAAGVLIGWLLARRTLQRAGVAADERERALRDELSASRAEVADHRRQLSQDRGDAVVALLSEYAGRLGALEQQHQRDAAVLERALVELRRSNEEVRSEARRLASALSDAKVRGSWGEVQLRRVLEVSGLSSHVDFAEQVHLSGPEGTLRPDAVVHLPNDRRVVIDAKAPLDAYLRAANCEHDDDRSQWLERHAAALGAHVHALGRRSYERHVPGAVDFVVLFVPGDVFLTAAFELRPELLESAARQNVILASPSTLLAFLRGVAAGWRERRVADEAAAVAALGRELYERLAIFSEHLTSVGSALGRAVGSYNAAIGSFERRVLVSARRFDDLGVETGRALVEAPLVDPVRGEPARPDVA